MKVVLQKKGNLLYLQENDSWTRDELLARSFPNTLNALNFCQARQLSGVQIRLTFENHASDIILPLPQNMGNLKYDTQRVRTLEG